MSIQSGINQLLGMGAIASQLPGGQELKEKGEWKRNWNKLQKAEAKTGVDYKNPVINESNVNAYQAAINARQEYLAKGKAQLAKNPSEFNLRGQAKGIKALNTMEDAMNKWKEKAEQQLEQKGNLKILEDTITYRLPGDKTEYPIEALGKEKADEIRKKIGGTK